ncbi:tyrosine-type recombinase/integrase [Oceanobacillus sp. FSL H7-0719]|uniref:tyrosine-type recombinase/integrase n=1 Tax=Oceanobacillus sp. FSL H7-0719 TaxID=2954507 RepID=UPI003246C33F
MGELISFKLKTGFEHIQFFLDGLESESTRSSYENNIRMFVEWKWNIPIEHIQPSHFNSLTYTDTQKFRNHLRRKYTANTTNNKMVSLFSLLSELNKIQSETGEYLYDINIDKIRTKSLRVTDVNSSGDITWEEVDEWIEHLKTNPINNSKRKCTFLHLARVTGLRKEALAELTYRDLRKNGSVWQLKSTLKGKTRLVSIKDEDVQMLYDIRKDETDKDEKILKLSSKTMERTIAYLKETFDIPEERNVTVHSLRGLSIYEAYLSSGNDILVAQAHAGHSKLETTYGYIKSRNDVVEQPSLYMGKEFNDENVEGLDAADWSKIYGGLSRSAKYEIEKRIKELGLLAE